MAKLIRRTTIITLIVMMINLNVFAKYNLVYSQKLLSLNRDNSEIIYTIKKSEENYTNKNVVLEIDVNKKVENVDEFIMSEDGMKLTKEFTENSEGNILLSDKFGNTKSVNYEITNIDKIPPVIEGVEDGKTYNSNLKLDYKDNVGIKSINIERYGKLAVQCYTYYYDTSAYRGIDVNKDSIKVRIITIPLNTAKINYYINDKLIESSQNKQYTYSGLKSATNYNIKIEAIDVNNKVLDSYTNTITTKMFGSITSEKTENTFKVKITNLDSKVVRAISTEYRESDRNKITYTTLPVNNDRSMNATLLLSHVSDSIINENYYMQIHLKDGSDNTLQKITFVVRWNQNYVEENLDNDPYNIIQSGSYEVIVVDLAGNETKKNFILKK